MCVCVYIYIYAFSAATEKVLTFAVSKYHEIIIVLGSNNSGSNSSCSDHPITLHLPFFLPPNPNILSSQF